MKKDIEISPSRASNRPSCLVETRICSENWSFKINACAKEPTFYAAAGFIGTFGKKTLDMLFPFTFSLRARERCPFLNGFGFLTCLPS